MSDHIDGKLFAPPFSIREACMQASSFLAARGVEEPRENAELLLMHVLGMERSALLRDWREPFPAERLAAWERIVRRKAEGEPAQYLIGEQWFYGRPFAVSPAVLIPRPETELLVEAVLEAADRLWPQAASDAAAPRGEGVSARGKGAAEAQRSMERGEPASEAPHGAVTRGVGASETSRSMEHGEPAVEAPHGAVPRDWGASPAASVPTVLDVGTGSGAIGVTLAAERPLWRVAASDLSPDALEVARGNAARHGAAERMAFVQGDLLEPFARGAADDDAAPPQRIDVLVSNPPYIPAGDLPCLQREVRDYEPRLALDGGADGLDPYRRMIAQLPRLARLPRIVAFELGIRQAREVAAMLEAAGAWDDIRIVPDYAGIERHVIAVRTAE